MFVSGKKFNPLIEDYLKHEDVFDLLEPNIKKDRYKVVDTENVDFLGYIKDGIINGVIIVESRSNAYVNFHPYMQKKHRKLKRLMIDDFELFIARKGIKKLTVEFPCFYLNLKRFAEDCGYNLIGVNDKSYNYKGDIVDQYIYGKVI